MLNKDTVVGSHTEKKRGGTVQSSEKQNSDFSAKSLVSQSLFGQVEWE